jgi:FtsH-binding integral membrane protein
MSETQGGGGEGFPPGSPPQHQPYGPFPAAPPRATPVERPAPVQRAAFAWWGAVACWFLGSLLSQVLDGNLFQFTTFRSVRLGDGTVVTRTTEGPLPVGVAVVTFLLLGALWALLVYGMYRGAGWARTLLAIFGVLGILNVVLQLIMLTTADPMNGGNIAHLVFYLGVLGLSIAGFFLMFRDGAAPFFVKRR